MGKREEEEDSRVTWEFLVCVTAWMVVFLADKGHAEEVILSLSFLDGV